MNKILPYENPDSAKEYRHEYKFVCSDEELALIDSRLNMLCPLDSHAGQSGIYSIRSLYFDDCDNSAFTENENGSDDREKFRIRMYNGDTSVIRLEIKEKYRGMTKKLSERISIDDCKKMLDGTFEPNGMDSAVLNRFYIKMRTRFLKPSVIVEYDRQPFVYDAGNVRLTFDKNIRASSDLFRFTEENLCFIPVLPAGKHVFEVKYDEFLPGYLSDAIGISMLQQSRFSKFYLCKCAL